VGSDLLGGVSVNPVALGLVASFRPRRGLQATELDARYPALNILDWHWPAISPYIRFHTGEVMPELPPAP
jgi:hypothetical protein